MNAVGSVGGNTVRVNGCWLFVCDLKICVGKQCGLNERGEANRRVQLEGSGVVTGTTFVFCVLCS